MLWLVLILFYPVLFYLVNRICQQVAESNRLPKLLLIPLLVVLFPGIIVGFAIQAFDRL